MDHDFNAQRRETENTLVDLAERNCPLPAIADFDFYFVSNGSGARPEPAVSDLKRQGYAAVYSEEYNEIQVVVYALSVLPEAIWQREKLLTEICLRQGFTPDGWGFLNSSKLNEV
ncbi:hypothetical protein RSK20926_12454 [Roseobacter sp. SK209-2-6]|uniref:ribonuclease E inhibitor RraB n=1 Tax=Roseobacter sp. SK209-2-6 TaxID=388739 RepID=UPI0000F3C653|nr:ribonuclease E inhibitor RraB [Roseobacter sp. SK209-2-6]EBA18532.1 hypothetical protein RSK20926_12454 [Roseobacter sp. SK209-2-6]